MNDAYRSDDSDDLALPLEAAIRATLSDNVPADAVERVKLRAKQLAGQGSPTPTAIPPRRRGTRSIYYTGAAVAVALTIVLGLTSWLDQSRGNAFAQMVANVKAASTVQCTTFQRFGKQEQFKGRILLEGQRLRNEPIANQIAWIADVESRKGIFLNVHLKTARPVEVTPEMARNFANPVDELRNLKLADGERMGEEDVQGIRTQVYRVKHLRVLGMAGVSEMLVWMDVKTQLPVKIVARESDPKHPFELRFEDFIWNQPIDAALFSLDLPAGYRLEKEEPQPPTSVKPPPAIAVPTAHPDFAQGVVSNDRVPGSLMLNSDGTTLTAMMRDPESVAAKQFWPHELRQWDLTTGKWKWKTEVAGASSFATTADARFLATVIGFEMQLRDASTGQIVRTWANEKDVSPLAFSPDGKVLAAGIAEWRNGQELPGGIQFWDVEHGSLVRTIADDKPISFLKYSVDGKLLVTSSNSGPVKLWNAQNGELVRVFPGLLRADFSPDGKLLACPSSDRPTDKAVGMVNLYDLNKGELVRSLTSEKGATASYLLWVAFSPDGHKLVGTDWNGTVTMWNVATGERIPTNVTHKAGVLVAQFSPDGTTLITGSEDKTLRLWRLPKDTKEPDTK